MKFTADIVLKHGFECVASFEDKPEKTIKFDQSVAFGGKDIGACPIEMMLASVAACTVQTFKAYSYVMGYGIEKIDATIQGTYDLGKFLMLNEEANSYTMEDFKLILKVKFDDEASKPITPEAFEKISTLTEANCPVCCIMRVCPTRVFEIAE